MPPSAAHQNGGGGAERTVIAAVRDGVDADDAGADGQVAGEIAVVAGVQEIKGDRGIEQRAGILRATIIHGGGNRRAGCAGKNNANVAAGTVLRQHGQLQKTGGAVVDYIIAGGRGGGRTAD